MNETPDAFPAARLDRVAFCVDAAARIARTRPEVPTDLVALLIDAATLDTVAERENLDPVLQTCLGRGELAHHHDRLVLASRRLLTDWAGSLADLEARRERERMIAAMERTRPAAAEAAAAYAPETYLGPLAFCPVTAAVTPAPAETAEPETALDPETAAAFDRDIEEAAERFADRIADRVIAASDDALPEPERFPAPEAFPGESEPAVVALSSGVDNATTTPAAPEARTCPDCGKPVGANSRTGRCRSCAGNAVRPKCAACGGNLKHGSPFDRCKKCRDAETPAAPEPADNRQPITDDAPLPLPSKPHPGDLLRARVRAFNDPECISARAFVLYWRDLPGNHREIAALPGEALPEGWDPARALERYRLVGGRDWHRVEADRSLSERPAGRPQRDELAERMTDRPQFITDAQALREGGVAPELASANGKEAGRA